MQSFKKALALAASLIPFGALADEAAPASPIDAIVVTTSRENLIGTADTASQGSVTQQEIALRPVYRVGQLLESMPGLVVTIHSGEGKANQYLLRGENLDHGVDLAGFVDDMPVNRPTNTHGQGYSDLRRPGTADRESRRVRRWRLLARGNPDRQRGVRMDGRRAGAL